MVRLLIQRRGDTWSIGGKQSQTLTSPVVGAGDGLSGSHNKYESDGSPGRGDYYRELFKCNTLIDIVTLYSNMSSISLDSCMRTTLIMSLPSLQRRCQQSSSRKIPRSVRSAEERRGPKLRFGRAHSTSQIYIRSVEEHEPLFLPSTLCRYRSGERSTYLHSSLDVEPLSPVPQRHS